MTDDFRRLQERAHRAVTAAIEVGSLIRPDRCAGCDYTVAEIRARPHVFRRGGGCEAPRARLFAHHTDYARPLDVVWLCSRCHGKVHGTASMFEAADATWAVWSRLQRFVPAHSRLTMRFATEGEFDAHVAQRQQERQEMAARLAEHKLARERVLSMSRAERLDEAARRVRDGIDSINDAARFTVSADDWGSSAAWRNWQAAVRRRVKRLGGSSPR